MSALEPQELDPRLCDICRRLDLAKLTEVEKPQRSPWIILGSMCSIVRKQYCPFCRLVLQLLPYYDASLCGSDTSSGHECLCEPSVELNLNLQQCFQVQYRTKSKEQIRGYICLPESNVREYRRGQVAAAEFPDAGTQQITAPLDPQCIRNMILDCEKNHKTVLQDNRTLRFCGAVDLLLIDVSEDRLVRETSNARFFALSYVWGDVEVFHTTTANRPSLEQPGGLRRVWHKIPRVIQDAIQFLRMIGERFIWVDSLCIEQDDPIQKKYLILQMDVVYSHAFITLIAIAGNNARAPLPGVAVGTRRKSVVEEQIGTHRIVAVRPSFGVIRWSSIYETRAWTFQEKLLSQRCLIFTDHQIFYCCHGQIRSDLTVSSRCEESEDTADLEISGASKTKRLGPISEMKLDREKLGVADYIELVEEYTRRHLSNHPDMLNGIAGILSFLQHRYNWEIICGTPRQHLDICLLWASVKPGGPKRIPQFSSWSWAGWTGEKSWSAMYEFNSIMLQHRVARNLDSYITNLILLSPITSNVAEKKINRKNQPSNFPQPSEATGVRNAGTLVERCSLFFEAFTVPFTSFTIGNTTTYRHSHLEASTLQISSGEQCGVVFGLPKTPHVLNADLPTCEYVLLSRLERPLPLWDTHKDYAIPIYDKILFPTSDRSLLNVLLVEHTDHGTERLAIGVVHEMAWESCMAVKKSITLV